jgi:hypothetical protein
MTNDPMYVLMFEELGVGDDDEAASLRPSEESPQLDVLEVEVGLEPESVVAEHPQTKPVAQFPRTAPCTAEISTAELLAVASDSRLASPPPGVSAAPADGLGRVGPAGAHRSSPQDGEHHGRCQKGGG